MIDKVVKDCAITVSLKRLKYQNMLRMRVRMARQGSETHWACGRVAALTARLIEPLLGTREEV